jgi:hypothetical protein
MDSIRKRFFWQGGGKIIKYHMAKWESITNPRDFGGLIIINTRRMIWKIVNREDSLWCDLLYAKYMKNSDFFLHWS